MVDTEQRGTLTISIDVELAWGFCDAIIPASIRDALQRERVIIQGLLALFTRYDIRATWAVVGHLLADQCDWKDGQVHPEIDRPITGEGERDWFFQHPRNPHDPWWYGRDIVEWIAAASPVQEIGSHSFCHLPYCEKKTPRAAIQADIRTAKTLHQSHGFPFEAFIFPRNVIGYRDVVAEAGIRVYRGHSPRWYDDIPFRSVRRLLNLLSFLVALPPRTVTPTIDDVGLVNVPESMLLSGRSGLRQFIPAQRLVAMGKAGLHRAVERGEIFHLWFHPSNFAHKMGAQFQVLEEILRYAQALRIKDHLTIMTMGEIQKNINTYMAEERA